eukprot:SAG31_NODE_14832_length_785_cov_1.297376_1_plen_29_part_01
MHDGTDKTLHASHILFRRETMEPMHVHGE